MAELEDSSPTDEQDVDTVRRAVTRLLAKGTKIDAGRFDAGVQQLAPDIDAPFGGQTPRAAYTAFRVGCIGYQLDTKRRVLRHAGGYRTQVRSGLRGHVGTANSI